MDMHEDLRWLAENVSEWPKGCERIALDPDGEVRFSGVGIGDDFYPERPLRGAVKLPAFVHSKNQGYLKAEWQAARQQLEDERINNAATPEEDEEWQAMEERQKQRQSRYSAYFKDVSHLEVVDVYRTVELFGCEKHGHPISHAAKKLLLTGSRTGGKDVETDVREAIDTLRRWLEMRQEDKLRGVK